MVSSRAIDTLSYIIVSKNPNCEPEVLTELAKLIDKSSVQLTERECIVTDINPDAKHVLLTRDADNVLT
jgi:hypothetical protein